MPDSIATAFVEIKPTIDDAAVKRSMEGATAVVKREARQMDKALEGIDARGAFNEVEREAERSTEAATGHFKEMARQSDAAVKGMGKGFSGVSKGIGGVAGKVGLIGGALAGLGVGAFFKSSLTAATESQAQFRGLQSAVENAGTAVGVTADQVASFAQNLGLKIGVDDEEIVAASRQLLAFKNVTDDTFLTAQTLAADVSATFGTSLTGSTKLLGKALNDPVKGMNALKRVGVTFTEQQKEQIETLVASGDVLGAQNIILQQLETRVGGAAEATATGAQKMSVAFDELKETAGAGLAGAVEGLVPSVTKLFEKLGPVLGKLGDSLGGALGPVIDALGPALSTLVDAIGPVLGDIGKSVKALAPVFEPLVEILGVVGQSLSSTFAATLEALAPTIEVVVEFLGEFAEVLEGALGDAFEDFLPIIAEIGEVLAESLADVLPLILDLFKDITPIILSVGNIFKDVIAKAIPIVSDVLEDLLPIIGDIADIIGDVLLEVLPVVADAFFSILDAVRPILPILGDALLEIITALKPILPVLAETLGTVAEALGEILIAITPLLPPLLDLVTLLIEELGVPALQALATAIGVVAEALAAVVTAISGFIQNLGPKLKNIKERFANVWKAISDRVTRVWNNISEFVTGIIESVSETISSVINGIKETWNTIWGGIRTTIRNVWDRIQVIVETALGAVGDFIGLHLTAIKLAFSVFVEGVKTIWRGLTAIVNFFKKYIFDPISNAVETLLNGIVSAFDLTVKAVETVWNTLKDVVKVPINIVIGFYKNGIRAVWNNIISKIPGVGNLPDVAYLNQGGRVPGSGNRDTVPAMLTPGEFVINKKAAKLWGSGLLKMLNNPKGTIDPAIFGYQAGGYARSADEAISWAKTHAGAPYVFAATGPNAFDCSGWTSALVNYILGHPNPYTRRHSSGTVGSDPALKSGSGVLTLGSRPPYMTNAQGVRVGHIVATLAGGSWSMPFVNSEATPPQLLVGAGARGAVGFPYKWHLPGYTGLSDEDYIKAQGLAGLKTAKVEGLTGPIGGILQKMINRLPGIVFDFFIKKLPKLIFDTVWDIVQRATPLAAGGRIMRSGPIVVGENGPEMMWGPRGAQVTPNDAFGRGDMHVQVFIGDQELSHLVTRVVRVENDVASARLQAGLR